MANLTLLKSLNFGSQVAEEEIEKLQEYFVQTDQWERIYRGDVDLVRGEKGAGKSAIYLLLGKHSAELNEQDILVTNGENPRGATVFKDLISDPPASEREFIVLWKLYLATLLAHKLREENVKTAESRKLFVVLEESGLLERELNLAGLLRAAQAYARRLLENSQYEAEMKLDSITGLPTGIVGRVSLGEPPSAVREKGIASLDGLFALANQALTESNKKIWILLDRLDVAFAESHELEANAIRALIRVYGDLRNFENLAMKIFLREDIYRRVTEGGFREASHITRYVVMKWTPEMLLHLILRRILSNPEIVDHYGVDVKSVLGDYDEQKNLFYRLFPSQVEQGEKKSSTFDWIVGRCADGSGDTAPREIIQLLNSLREQEIGRLERGEDEAPEDQIFDRSVFKAALPVVSETRLNTYLYAEFPEQRKYLEKLRGEKTEQTPESLAEIWGMNAEEATQNATKLADLGFFEVRGTRTDPSYWVPFLYRDALELVQGKASI